MRLYRGQPRVTREQPEWIRLMQIQSGVYAARGRWFTPELSIAQWYVDECDDGIIMFIDVPDEQVAQYQVSQLTEKRYSLDPEHEYFVPREWAIAACSL